jgi:hypothetical protein
MPNRSIRAQQASSTHQREYGENKDVCVCVVTVLYFVFCVVLAVMCICVIYKFFSLGL